MEQRQGDKAMVRPLYKRGLEVRCEHRRVFSCGERCADVGTGGRLVVDRTMAASLLPASCSCPKLLPSLAAGSSHPSSAMPPPRPAPPIVQPPLPLPAPGLGAVGEGAGRCGGGSPAVQAGQRPQPARRSHPAGARCAAGLAGWPVLSDAAEAVQRSQAQPTCWAVGRYCPTPELSLHLPCFAQAWGLLEEEEGNIEEARRLFKRASKVRTRCCGCSGSADARIQPAAAGLSSGALGDIPSTRAAVWLQAHRPCCACPCCADGPQPPARVAGLGLHGVPPAAVRHGAGAVPAGHLGGAAPRTRRLPRLPGKPLYDALLLRLAQPPRPAAPHPCRLRS